MKYGSVCSGIEAATVAWHSLGFEPAWFSEIEKFPSQMLAHHYPDVPNLGDMTAIADSIKAGDVEAPDLLVGGTPCQAFSLAGLRNSLNDDRGQLSLEFVRLANEIDSARFIRGEQASVVWENVPGVLSTKDNAFGCFLGALSGSGCELQPSGRKWPNAGCVFGPQRQITWRVFDAQYFGLAQRRKRVFVVASARTECIAEILFERKSVFGNPTQSRGKKENLARDREINTIRTSETISGKSYVPPLLASHGQKMWLGNQEAFCGDYYIKHAIGISPRSLGLANSEEISGTLAATDYKQPNAVITLGVGGMTTNAAISHEMYPTLLANHDRGYILKAYGIQGNIIGRAIQNGGNGIGFKEEQAPTLTNADRHGVVVHGTQDPLVSKDIAHCLGRNHGQENVLCKSAYAMIGDTEPKVSKEINGTLRANGGGGVVPSSVVYMSIARYLTEVECERLQGFPDNYTNMPKSSKTVRYKALGNSMAVPVMRWIGRRIQQYCEVKNG